MTAKVYFLPLADGLSSADQAVAMNRIYEAAGLDTVVADKDFVAIKTHVGEKLNTTHIKPELIRALVENVKRKGGLPFLTETSTLYRCERENAIKHIMHAHRQGFGIENIGAPFIMADGLAGNTEYEVEINGILHKSVKIAREISSADALIVVSHPTGHIAAGMGACIKNLGMGLASRMGKLRQHSAMLPEIAAAKCQLCHKCIAWCPQGAIHENEGKAYITPEKCVGCGECLVMCKFDAVKFDWGAESGHMQKSMAEHAYGVVKDKQQARKCCYINVLVDMTHDCDCEAACQEKLIRDIGILASYDPVAIDKATMDLTVAANGKSLAELSYAQHDATIQIRHAAQIGMGTMAYELVEVK